MDILQWRSNVTALLSPQNFCEMTYVFYSFILNVWYLPNQQKWQEFKKKKNPNLKMKLRDP